MSEKRKELLKIIMQEKVWGYAEWDSEKEMHWLDIDEEDAERIVGKIIPLLSSWGIRLS